MDPSRDELLKLAEQTAALQSALARVRDELAVATAAEEALVERLRELGVPMEADDAKTTIDQLHIPGVSRRAAHRDATGPAHVSMVKAGAVGAGLALAAAIVVLLIVNLAANRRADAVEETPALPSVTAGGAAASAPPPLQEGPREIPPPPAPGEGKEPASAPASLVSAVVAKNAEPTTLPGHGPSSPAVASGASASGASTSPTGGSSTGFLTIVCTPKCDAITDNNVALNPNGVVKLPVSAGAHKLVLTSGGVKRTSVVTINPGETREVRVSMEAGAQTDRGF